MEEGERAHKRVRSAGPSLHDASPRLTSLDRPVSPPLPTRRAVIPPPVIVLDDDSSTASEPEVESGGDPKTCEPLEADASDSGSKVVESPFSLTRIRDLPSSLNVDTLSLKDIIGSPLVKELWCFNYMIDIDFLMSHLDEDVRQLVDVHAVHGFWKKDSESRQAIEMQAARWNNVTIHIAYLPEPFGTHHTKMFTLFNHDDTAEVVIHTANVIPQDWGNMTQAVWKSPRLQLGATSDDASTNSAEGTGEKFKRDLIAYLRAYDRHRPLSKQLVAQLQKFDFTPIRASLVGSVPGRHSLKESQWGWPAVRRILSGVPTKSGNVPLIAMQMSSIATLGATSSWLSQSLFPAFSQSSTKVEKTRVRIIYPTAEEIRRSLDGYASGGSIHTKIQSAQQAKQLEYLKPMLCHWSGDVNQDYNGSVSTKDAGRKRAAPHIKTYVRYTSMDMKAIDWALVTSANLSKQAWGDAPKGEEVRICSYELGVMVWPGLWGDNVEMVPTFGLNTPEVCKEASVTVGFRMPYDAPLIPYASNDIPWVASMPHGEPDWRGVTWGR